VTSLRISLFPFSLSFCSSNNSPFLRSIISGNRSLLCRVDPYNNPKIEIAQKHPGLKEIFDHIYKWILGWRTEMPFNLFRLSEE
jgi:hypothetical protein